MNATKTIFFILVFSILSFSFEREELKKYEFKGVFLASDVFTRICDNCYLNLPPDFLDLKLVLSISTDNERVFERSLVSSALANDWELTKKNNSWRAEAVSNKNKITFISCLDNEVKNIDRFLYYSSLKSDSIKCAKRDSLNIIENKKNDSLANLEALPFLKYELKYFSVSKSFSEKMGVSWPVVLSSGNLTSIPDFFDDWALNFSNGNDSSFTYRSLIFSLDSNIKIDWGTEEQIVSNVFQENGVITTNYEFRKYGIITNISKTDKIIKLNFILRDKDLNTSILQGSSGGDINKIMVLSGSYDYTRLIVYSVPIISKIPYLGELFKNNIYSLDNRFFIIYLTPINM